MMTGVRALEPGVDDRGAAGGADLNIAADQGAGHRLAAGELDDFEILDSIFLEVASFPGRPERRLRGAEDGAGAQWFLSGEQFRREEQQR